MAYPEAMADSTVVRVVSEAELVSAVRGADEAGRPLLLLGDGSDVSLAEGFVGLVIAVATTGVLVNLDGCEVDNLAYCGGVGVTAAAGESWDDLVARSVADGWVGLAELSGLPGTVGDVVSRNPDAFGRTPADSVAAVRVLDRTSREVRTYAFADCGFAPGTSRFAVASGEPSGRYVILTVQFLLPQGDLTRPILDEGLARALRATVGRRVLIDDLRRHLLPTSTG